MELARARDMEHDSELLSLLIMTHHNISHTSSENALSQKMVAAALASCFP